MNDINRIQFSHLRKSFGTKVVLKDLSLTIRQGEIVFILGTSGTGKSVLLKCLVGLLKIDSGQIFIGNQEISRLSEEQFLEIRQHCGMVFQQPALFDSLSVFENIAFGLRRLMQLPEEEVRRRVYLSLQRVGLGDIGEKMPTQISYGMQKRVSLARTIALEPKILLFDEPTTGLDPISTNRINQLIQQLSRKLGTTSIVVSHDMKCAVEIADRIIVLHEGAIIEEGTVKQVLASAHPLVQEFLSDVRSLS